jgi:acetolactate synthase regulatory subunit
MVPPQIDSDALDEQFSKQISQQVQKATAELNHLEQLLKAGMVDRSVLTDFREAVNRVRHTGWAVQQTMEADTTKQDVAMILTIERVRAATQLSAQLTSDLKLIDPKHEALDRSKLTTLDQNLEALSRVLQMLTSDDVLEI